MENQLPYLIKTLTKKIPDSPNIRLQKGQNSLELILNPDLSEDEIERVTITQKEGSARFVLEYFSAYPNAFQTFLNERYSERINSSPALTKFREETLKVKNSEVWARFCPETGKCELRLVKAQAEYACYPPMKRDALFFAYVFKDKARHPRDYLFPVHAKII